MKILLFDIETTPNLGYTWDLYDQNVLHVVKPWELLCYAYKWLDEPKVTCISRRDFKDKTDKSLTKSLWGMVNQADIIIAHNGDKFDLRKSNAKFIEHGLLPPEPYKTIDTLKIARRHFKFTSAKLDALGEILGVGRKEKTGGFDLWLDCMANRPAAWKLMIKYNKQDVILLEKVYKKLLPWITNHPRVSGLVSCPKCGSKDLHGRGYRKTKVSAYRRYQCQTCGGWCHERVADKSIEKPKIID